LQEDEVETSRAADEGRITSNPGSDREDGDGGRVVQKKKKKPNQMKKKKKMKKKVAARPSVVLRVFEKNEPPAAVEAVQEEDEEEARRLFEEDQPPEKEDQEVLTPPEPVQQPTKKEKEDQTCPGDKYENETKPTRAEIYQKWSLFLASKTPAELARWNQSDREQAHKDAAEYCGVDVVYFKETVFGSKSA